MLFKITIFSKLLVTLGVHSKYRVSKITPNQPDSGSHHHHHHHRFKVRFSMLARVGLLSPTAFGSQLYKMQPLLKAPGFNPVLPGKLI